MGGLIAFGQVKGGVGKTSLAVVLADHLHRAGERVAVLDADPQGSAARWLDRMGLGVPVVEVEASDDPRGATIEAVRRALELAPFVVADPPPSSLEVLRVLLAVADLAVVPTGPTLEEIHLARRTVEIARQEAQVRRSPPRLLLAPVRLDIRTGLGRDALAALEGLGVPVAGTVVRHRIAWAEAMSAGASLFDLPASRAGEAIAEARALCAEIVARLHKDTRP
jgi:chromosome partitioning protein